MNFQDKLTSYIADINTYLHNTLDPFQGSVYDSMRYSLYAGGKRIRPVITVAVADILNGNKNAALCFGSSLEMIHTYSLIHDDLPCMDNDDLRRGKPTNHIVFGEDTAVLAGDALLNFACENIVNNNDFSADMRIKALEVIYNASGAEGMIGGQIMDMYAENNAVDMNFLETLHKKKTGALIKASARLGAIASDKEYKLLDEYASALGLAFQIRDDILDIEGDVKKFGKPIQSDSKNNKTTYVKLFGIGGAKSLLQEETEKAISALDFLGNDAWFLRELALYLLNREN